MIPITKPMLGAEEGDAARLAVESGWVTQGPKVAEFEQAVASYCGAEHAVATSNCTTALHLSLLIAGVGPGDEVICPSMSFIATCNAIRYTGATPVFADVDVRTYNLDPIAAERAITPRTKAILLVHQIGLPADLDQLDAVAKKHNLQLVEDAACAIGSRHRGQAIGGRGNLTCFSFHPRKVITTGEGGMITTNNAEHAHELRLLRQHGMSVSDTARHASRKVMIEQYEMPGYNYRMTDIQAAIGLEQMQRLPGIVARRQERAARYTAHLLQHPWLRPPYVPDYAESNYQSYAAHLDADAPLRREELMQQLLDKGIATRRGIMLSHKEPACADLAPQLLPESEAASGRSLLLPLYPQMTDDEQQQVLDAIDEIAMLHSRTAA